jgi:hypothetical protein
VPAGRGGAGAKPPGGWPANATGSPVATSSPALMQLSTLGLTPTVLASWASSPAKAKAEAGDATLSGLNATGTPFVWDGTEALNYQDPTWLTKIIG